MDRFVVRKAKVPACDSSSEGVVKKKPRPDESPGPSSASCANNAAGVSIESSDPTDIGTYVDRSSSLSDDIIHRLLIAPRKPEGAYVFPTSEHTKRGRVEHRQVQENHFKQYPWLVFSPSKQGLFCLNCAIFVHKKMVGTKTGCLAKKLVTEPLTKFAKLSGKDGDLEKHATCGYHSEASTSAKMFLATRDKPEIDIRNQLSTQRMEQIKENRARLVPIIKTIILHGRQNIPLRGHRDDGSLLANTLDENTVVTNEGNFRALLRFRIDAGDLELKNHLETSKSNATYISKTTCDELIKSCEAVMLNKIRKKIQVANCYSIIFDETTDISHTSQLSLAARYVDENGKLQERFLGFVDIHDDNENQSSPPVERSITGEILGNTVLKKMESLSLVLENCVGIACDGCSVNMSEFKGAVTTIQKKAINARVSPCRSHQLNLAISRSCRVPNVRNALGTVEEVVAFFTASSKRFATLKSYLKHSLLSHCQTRWVERHDAIVQFAADLPTVGRVLREISDWRDRTTASKAAILLRAMSNSDFIITLFSLSDIMSVTHPLSKILQNPTMDVATAKMKIDATLNVYDEMRTNSDVHFARIVEETKTVMEELNVEMCIPRLAGRQSHRAHFDVNDDPIAYWRKVVFVPTLDHVTADMRERFCIENFTHLKLNIILPSQLKHVAAENLPGKLEDCLSVAPFFDEPPYMTKKKLMAEVLQYRQINMKDVKNEDSVMEALAVCSSNEYPTLHKLYTMIACLPVSIATVERSFSTLRRTKTWLRSTMNENRLNGLALLNTHLDIDCSVEEVIDHFARKSRKIDFVL